MSRRIVWVDMARGLAMLTILWAHTSVYYADGFASSYTLTVLNALAVFFFVSGYLFMSPDKEFSVGHKLRSVFRSLVVPYLIFTLAMAFPKAVAHGSDGKRVRDAAFFLIIMLVTFAATLLNPQKYVSSRTIQKCVEHVSTST